MQTTCSTVTGAQIATGLGAGTMALGLLIFILRHIFLRLDKKVDASVFKEYTKRIADNLANGTRRFDKIDKAIETNTEAVNNLCIEFASTRREIKTVTMALGKINEK